MSEPTRVGRPRVVVVGGGLAGMAAALRLGQQGVAVDLYEASDRLGGKAGSEPGPHGLSDHGYHVFPAWYHNLWKLVDDDLGIRDHFVEQRWFYRLPHHRAAELRGDGKELTRAHHRALMSPRTIFSSIDLASRRTAYLEELSLSGFLRSRWYNGLETARELRDISMKGLGNPSWDASSLTYRQNMRLWLKVLHRKGWTALDGNLQERFIEPFERALEKAGVTVHRNAPVQQVDVAGEGRRATIAALHIDGHGTVDVADLPVILAVPHEPLRTLLQPHLPTLPPEVQDVGYLRSQPMVALDVHLNRPVDGLPHGHVILEGSRFHLTMLDIRRLWGDRLDGDPTHPVLQLVAADTKRIEGLDEPTMTAELVDDLLAFFPFLRPDDVGDVVLHDNRDAPLFMNDVGTDRRRPSSDRRYGTNLLLAGDWCHTPIDLACMEGALVSGIQAGRVALRDLGRDEGAAPIVPKEGVSALAWLTRVTMSPVMWLFGLPVDLARWVRRHTADRQASSEGRFGTR